MRVKPRKSIYIGYWLLFLLIAALIFISACSQIDFDPLESHGTPEDAIGSPGGGDVTSGDAPGTPGSRYSESKTDGEGANLEKNSPATKGPSAPADNSDENRDLPAWWYMPDKDNYYPVARIVDGDTIVLKIDGYHRKIRLIGINAPESVHNDPEKNTAEGEAASSYLENLLDGHEVRLEYDVSYRDRFERDLCYCYLPDGTFINFAMVRAGHANLMTIPPNIKYVDLFKQALADAQIDKLGMWR
ncbi:MAG TPA: hypothetical protein GXZ59_06495 [Clostridiaceae bacterium]|nr:hypothetical protein [Clostridiaceae bacterium]